MFARSIAATPWGIEARPVEVEVEIRSGLPQIRILGLPDVAVRGSKERVRAALKSCGFDLPLCAVVVSLAPADLRKRGNHLDLAIALALLAAHGDLPEEALQRRLLCGELGLDGSVRPVRGGLAIADLGRRLTVAEVVLPAANAAEAAALGSVPVVGVGSLAETIRHVRAMERLPAVAAPSSYPVELLPGYPDLAEVRGQDGAKRALEIAAAGGHNLLMIGPPGSGKTLLARCLPGLLPPLTTAEAIEVTKIHSLVAEEPPAGLIRRRPFRAPHAAVRAAALVGGGPFPRPGEMSLAHGGVLFIHELPKFRRDALESLREPLEEGQVTVARARMVMPARFSLVAACGPCPCGFLGDSRRSCRCTPPRIERYRARIPGSLFESIDLYVEVPAVTFRELRGAPGEGSREVAARVAAARALQTGRFDPEAKTPANALITAADLGRHCALDAPGRALLDAAFEKLGLSARALDRVMRVARTIADLAGGGPVRAPHLAEVIQFRSLDRQVVE